jgi:hypothetical protein
MAVFDSYSSRSGEIFFNEIYKSSKQIDSQKTSQSILFMCRAKFGTNQLKSMKTPRDAGTTGAAGASAPLAFCIFNSVGAVRVQTMGVTGAQNFYNRQN